MNSSRKIKIQYLIGGILFGICFPAMAYVFDFIRLAVDFSFRGLVFLHETNPIHFIIDTAPIVLGTLAFYLGKSKAAIERQYKELLITTQFRDQFFANMSHELRTPMNGVTGIVFIIR